jgi:hypothetical protein
MEDDYGFYEDLDSDDDDDIHNSSIVHPLFSDDDESSDDALSIPVCGTRIDDENAESLVTSPPILTPFMVDAIAEEGLPWSMQDTQWDRLFASSRDGTSFGTFMRRVRGQKQTIIVAKTSDGKIVGGYATDVWSGRKQASSESEGEQANHSFLFVVEPPTTNKATRAVTPTSAGHTFIPGLEEFGTSPTSAFDFDNFHETKPRQRGEVKPHVEIFKSSQKQHLANAAKLSNKVISMSDGSGNLSLVIENSFSRGNACTSGTREDRDREEFTIVEFEVYGFSED